MGACCCYFFVERPNTSRECSRDRQSPYSNRSRRAEATQRASGAFQDSQRPHNCRYCGIALDLSLIDGHEESCRANHRLTSDLSAPTPKFIIDDDSDIENANEDELCVVCFQHRRCYVFLPCGHIACCGECVKRLDTCPICRANRTGLCYVPANVISKYYCSSCGEFIAPTLFDGHRETCALILRKVKEEQQLLSCSSDPAKLSAGQGEEDAAIQEDNHLKSLGSLGNNEQNIDVEVKVEVLELPSPVSHNKHISERCVECGKEDSKLVICIPCGHRVMCGACAASRSTCSVCLQEIKQTLNAFV